MTKTKWILIGLLIVPVLAVEMYVGLRVPAEIRRNSFPKSVPSTMVAGSFETTQIAPSEFGSEEWDRLLSGWETNNDDQFHTAMEWVLANGPEMVPTLRKNLTSVEESFESRLFSAELLLRINPKFDKKELLQAMEALCSSEEGRIKLKEYIKNKEGEIEIYEIALEALESVASLERFPKVLDGLYSENVSDRILALEEASYLRGDLNALRTPVQNCLTDIDPQVRSTALNLLPKIFPMDAGGILSNVLVTERDQNVVFHAGRVLSQVATLDILPELERLLAKGSRPVTRLAVAHVVSAMKKKPSVSWVENNVLPEIWDLLGDQKKASNRAGAAALLSRFTKTYGSNLDPSVKETVDAFVQAEKDPWVSTFLVRAQNEFGS